MKSSKGVYILLPVAIIVWGFIGYRFLKYLKQDNVAVTEINAEDVNFKPENFALDTFSIIADYRDPFLGDIEQPKIQSVHTPAAKPAPKNNGPWPVIVFKGLVKNNVSNRACALITIGGKTKSLFEKNEALGVTVISIQRDSITVMFNGEKKSFHKKQVLWKPRALSKP